MQNGGWSIGPVIMALALLAACGGEAPVEDADASVETVDTADDVVEVTGEEQVILAFGDSLFAGYNLAEDEGYPEQLEDVLRARGINARLIDAGVSGDTTAAGLQRIGFVLDNLANAPDLALVELGGNDLLRGITPTQTRANLDGILQQLERRNIPVLLMGMQAPPNLGAGFREDFNSIYSDLARDYSTELVPFWLEAIVDRPELIQADRVHPTAEGIALLVSETADDVAAALPAQDD